MAKCSLFFVFHDLIDDDEDKLIITVEVKRNNMSIEWNETLSDTNGKEFKEMSLAVKTQLSKDLKELSVNQIKVKSFKPKEGNTFCEFECRVNSKAVTKEDIEKVLNMIVEIGVEKRQLQQSQDQKDEPPVGVIVFAALILCAMIIAFVVVVSAFLYTANEDYLRHRAVILVKLASSNNEVHGFGEFETASQVCITFENSPYPQVFI